MVEPNGTSLQIVDPAGKSTAICGIPLVRSATVFFHPSGSDRSHSAAKDLASSVRDLLLNLSTHATLCDPACTHGLSAASSCSVCSAQQRVKLLVLVGDDERVTVPDE